MSALGIIGAGITFVVIKDRSAGARVHEGEAFLRGNSEFRDSGIEGLTTSVAGRWLVTPQIFPEPFYLFSAITRHFISHIKLTLVDVITV